jgi:hypothetical protein
MARRAGLSNVDGLTEGCWSGMAGFAPGKIGMRARNGDVVGTIGRWKDGSVKEVLEYLVLYPSRWCAAARPLALPLYVSRSGKSWLRSEDGIGFLFRSDLC